MKTHMKEFGNTGEVTGKVALGPFRYTLATPGDEDVLGQAGVGVGHFHIGKLDSTLREFFDQVYQFPSCNCV